MPDALNGPFCQITTAWLDTLERAQQVKNQRFQPEAEEGLRFYSGPYDFYFNELLSGKNFRVPQSQKADVVVTFNKVAELVQIFGPALYHQNPTRRLTTRQVPNIDPNLFLMDPATAVEVQQIYQLSMQEQMTDRAIGALLEALLNVTPHKLDLKTHARAMIDESLITGLGLLWHDYETIPATGKRVCGSRYGSSLDFLMDPDAKTIQTIGWCARKTLMHKWEAERKWRIPQGMLHGTQYSAGGMAFDNAYKTLGRDMVEVWEIWSKIGCGGRLPHCIDATDENRVAFELMGDYCYMVVVKGHPWPLNLPPWMFGSDRPNAWQDAQRAVQWPTPYWIDGGWPFTPTYYHTIPNQLWPMSHLTPGMGELKFLNWGMAKIASKIAVTSRDIIFTSDQIAEEVDKVIKMGLDLTVCKVQGMENMTIEQLVKTFQHPEWNPDIWKVMQAISEAFDQRVGLSELLYGQSTRQMRSAEEAQQKYETVNLRPDDMANKVEDAMSKAAEREKWCSRWHYRAEDVNSLVGIAGAYAWEQLVLSQPPERVLDLQARVEADSSKKPNKSAQVEAINMAMQNLVQPLFAAAQAGMLDPFNALTSDWLEAMGIQDKHRYLLQMPPVVAPPEDPNRSADREAEAEEREKDRKAQKEQAAAKQTAA